MGVKSFSAALAMGALLYAGYDIDRDSPAEGKQYLDTCFNMAVSGKKDRYPMESAVETAHACLLSPGVYGHRIQQTFEK